MYNGNAVNLHSGGARFESQPGILTKAFRVFPQFLLTNVVVLPTNRLRSSSYSSFIIIFVSVFGCL